MGAAMIKGKAEIRPQNEKVGETGMVRGQGQRKGCGEAEREIRVGQVARKKQEIKCESLREK